MAGIPHIMATRKGLQVAGNNHGASGLRFYRVCSPGPALEICEWLHFRSLKKGRNTILNFAFHFQHGFPSLPRISKDSQCPLCSGRRASTVYSRCYKMTTVYSRCYSVTTVCSRYYSVTTVYSRCYSVTTVGSR